MPVIPQKLVNPVSLSLSEFSPYCSLAHDSPISAGESEIAIATLKENMSPVENGIRSELVKWGGQTLTRDLLEFFSGYWSGGSSLPRTWLDAVVISIYK